MNNAEVMVLVEGQTEKNFIQSLLEPYFANQGIYLFPTLLSKPGQKGGNVCFSRAKIDIGNHLKQRANTYITLMVDYYGIGKDWPGFRESKRQATHYKKAEVMNRETAKQVQTLFPELNRGCRFIPYVSMHEIEALYFSDPVILAKEMNIDQTEIESILSECGEPEAINDNIETAPSKRLERLYSKFKKTTTGTDIAKAISIPQMRKCCRLFNEWVSKIENL
jgi:hypothetical protein